MCRKPTWLVSVAAVLGLIQSFLWIAAAAVVTLVYCCVIPIRQYSDKSDFFRVTLVKLYFEGPKCIPDGSYLGNFNEKYRNSNLLARDAMMFLMIAYIIINVIYCLLSIGLYLKRHRRSRFFSVGWSVVTLILCALDAGLSYCLIYDYFTLTDYIANNNDLEGIMFGGLPFIPLLLFLASSRVIILWVWNAYVGFYLFFLGACGENRPDNDKEKKKEMMEEKPKVTEEPKHFEEERTPEEKGNVKTMNDILTHPEYADYKWSMEAATRFLSEEGPPREVPHRNWCYAPPCENSYYPKSHSKGWEATNEGYVSDMVEKFENIPDFEHNLKNFEPGQRKIKVTKPPVGRPVGIPVPPPLPPSTSCNC